MTTAKIAKKAVANKGERVIIGKQAKAPVRVPDGDYLAQFVGPTRFTRSGQAIVQDVWLLEPNATVPLYANIPKNGITRCSKIGQLLAALGIPADEDCCTDTLQDRRCWVRVRTSTWTIAYDGELEGRTRVNLAEDRWESRVARVLRVAGSDE
jgi:hypothetical protein